MSTILDRIHLLYCGGDKDYDGILFSALSAMRRTKRPITVTVYTAALDHPLGRPVDEQKANYLRALLERRDDGSTLALADMTSPLEKLLSALTSVKDTEDPYALLPLLADVGKEEGRILYLDRSALFCGDAGRLFDCDLKGRALGGVRDLWGSFFCRTDYVNCGVLLIDLGEARKERFFAAARRVLTEYRVHRPFSDAVNYAGKPLCLLPEIYNEQFALRRDTVVRHYCAGLRLFPYPHRSDGTPENGYCMSDREYRLFKRVYEEYLLQREGRKAR